MRVGEGEVEATKRSPGSARHVGCQLRLTLHLTERSYIMSGGYVDCACRDCFDIAIGKVGEALCLDCEEAGCEANDGECQRTDAYGSEEEEPGEPEEGDITTHDEERWFQDGKLYFTGDRKGLRARMDVDGFWPNVWVISDHGNACLITL